MAEIDLETKFPDLRPISKPPSLFTVNGCGLVLYGNRDLDPETGTYIKSQCLALIFVPLFAIGAYRVADAEEGGWYFIGKEPLSGFARMMNAVMVASIIGAIGIGYWVHHINTADYIAAKKLKEADELAANEEWKAAAGKYLEVVDSNTKSKEKARDGLQSLVENACAKAPADAVLEILRVGESLKFKNTRLAGLTTHAVAAAERFQKSDPGTAFEIIKFVEGQTLDPLEQERPDPKRLAAMKKSVLLALVKNEPEYLEAVGALAVILEGEGKRDECRKLLEPRAAALGETEGARVLGQIYAREGEIEQAHRLLVPYCQQRLKSLHAALKTYNTSKQAIVDELIAVLEGKRPPGEHAEMVLRLKKTPRDQQAKVFSDYVSTRLREDERLNRASSQVSRLSRIVPVALDLGMVQLRRGQRESDPAKRKAELKKAEETFLAIRGIAGKTNKYRLFLGQVYYWLGRQKEGRKLFDDLLAAQKRSTQILLTVCQTLRSLGAEQEARRLADEAYQKTSDDRERYAAAGLRARLSLDLDDRIKWLKKCDPKNKMIQADLSIAQGAKAARRGDDAGALAHYRSASRIYNELPETSTTLNNGALAWLRAFSITGDSSDFDHAAKRIEKAVSLMPTDAILVANSGSVLYSGAMQSIIGKPLEPAKLQLSAEARLLVYLYKNETERKPWIEQVRNHRGIKKSLTYLNNATMLAPKRSSLYARLLEVHIVLQNTSQLAELLERVKSANVDTADSTRSLLDSLKGKDEAKNRKRGRAGIERFRKAMAKLDSKQGPSAAMASSVLAMKLAEQWNLGVDVDADEVVRLCEAAHKNAPSHGTLWSLKSAYLFRGLTAAMKQDKQLAARIDKFRRILSPDHLVAAFLQYDDASAKTLRANADIRKAVELVKEANRAFPGSVSPFEWALLSGFDPSETAALTAEARRNRRSGLETRITRLLSPASPSAALDYCWLLRVQGKDAEAANVVAELAKLGIPLPVKN